jgi:ribosomal-protein-alanine N-acetyltransferase
VEEQSQVRLRGYDPGDLDALFALDEICFEPAFRFSRAALRRFAETRRARVIVAEAAGVVVGFCITHIERTATGCSGYVVTLDVAPGWRERGLARRMMLNMEAQVRSEGCRTMLLHVFTGNAAAILFYERLGFERGHTAEAFYAPGLDAFVYRKSLS